jgi:hypothetical protein
MALALRVEFLTAVPGRLSQRRLSAILLLATILQALTTGEEDYETDEEQNRRIRFFASRAVGGAVDGLSRATVPMPGASRDRS